MHTAARISEHFFVHRFLNDTSIVLDFGANRGEFAREIIRRFGCAVYAVEADPELCAALPQMERLFAYNLALSAMDGEVVLRIVEGSCATTDPRLMRSGRDVAVKAVTLGNFLNIAGLAGVRIELAKLDIEGSELGVLLNTSPLVLGNLHMITVEFHDFLNRALCSDVKKVFARMDALGFQRIHWSKDNTDVLFVNKSLGRVGLAENGVLHCLKYYAGLERRTKRAFRNVIHG